MTLHTLPQNPTNITESPEFKEFCKNNNLEVFNLEAINVVFFQQQEMINEIAKKIKYEYYDIGGRLTGEQSLFDKWNKNEH